MSYFSRLTDIVTCNLSQLLAEAADPAQALREIIAEMREGLAGARRSVATATASEARIAAEIDEHRRLTEEWDAKAREELSAGREADARVCLLRKREVLDLIAGLEQQYRAAKATKDHLSTMQRALEARLAEATRRLEATGSHATEATVSYGPNFDTPSASASIAVEQVDAELETLKQQMGLK